MWGRGAEAAGGAQSTGSTRVRAQPVFSVGLGTWKFLEGGAATAAATVVWGPLRGAHF